MNGIGGLTSPKSKPTADRGRVRALGLPRRDPNLHTHAAVSAKVQGVDGKWRSLDARALYRMTVAASECCNTAFEATLTALLGVTFTPRPDTVGRQEPVREITTVSFGMIEFFSRRRAAIEARYAHLVRGYRREHRPGPSPARGPRGGRNSPPRSAKARSPS
jgi:hypothetical protein